MTTKVGVQRIMLESDYKTVVSKLNSKDRSIFGPVVEDVKGLLQTFGKSNVT